MTTRRWEKHYPPQLHDYRIDADSLTGNLADCARDAAQRFADAPAFTQVLPNGLHADLSFAEIERLSSAFAAYLIQEQSLQAGDVVALQLPNSLHYPIAVLGAWKAGLIVTNVNRCTPSVSWTRNWPTAVPGCWWPVTCSPNARSRWSSSAASHWC